jgi:hypothetical protein
MGERDVHDTKSDRGTTMDLSSLKLTDEPELNSFKFRLIAESTGSEVKIESEESELILNRDHLDPENRSISSDQHVIMRFRDGKIFIEDVSSNGSTFIQVQDKMIVNSETRIVFGNKMYLFTQGPDSKAMEDKNATRQFGDINLGKSDTNGFVIIEENTGNKINIIHGINILNRDNLDPGNISISAKEHANIEFQDGNWYLTDISSNKATFIQVMTEMQLTDKVKLILGNIIFRFEYN